MLRLRLLIGFAAAVALVLFALPPAPSQEAAEAPTAEPAPRPNVVFVLADDLGWGDLSCFGAAGTETPNLDRLAARGTRWTSFYVASPSCTPSRAAFLGGRFPQRYGFHSPLASYARNAERGMPQQFNRNWPNLARVMRDAGYETIHVGKYHLASNAAASKNAIAGLGFEKVHLLSEQMLVTSDPGEGEYLVARASRTCVDWALESLDGERDRPFYLQLWLTDPHAPMAPSAKQLERVPQYGSLVPGFTTPLEVYRATLMELDLQIGRLVAGLERRGLGENTVIVFASDNGPEPPRGPRSGRHAGAGSSGPFRGYKRSLYEGGVRVPLIVAWPGHVPAGRVDDESVLSGVDLLPTLAALAGAELSADAACDGEDQSAVWLGATRARTRDLFWSWHLAPQFGTNSDVSPCLAMRRGPWKLLLNPDGSRCELYDIVRDPFELDDLARDHSEVVAELRPALMDFYATLDPRSFEPGAGLPRAWNLPVDPARATAGAGSDGSGDE